MPGANYMGGKRNAARARIKDAEGKVQRSHFGKKRFEVLRTGLSKGGAARDVPREVPEISLAHARRRRTENGLESEHEWERNWTGLRSPSTSPVLHLRSPPPVNIASGRSKLLTKLDADDPSVRRAQIEKILQTPDLLGLSRTKGLARNHKVAIDESRTSREPIQQQRSFYNKCVSLKSPSIEGSLSSTMASHLQSTPSRSNSRGRTAICLPARSSRLSSHDGESVFVPMFLDSSPSLHVDDSGYAEFWPDPRPDCEPTRVPFYAQFAHTNLPQFAALTHPRVSSHPRPSLELPSPLIEARSVSPVPSSRPEPLEFFQLSPSDTSGFWSELASQSFLGSPDIPQASFSTSPPPFTELSDAKEYGCSSDLQCKLAQRSDNSPRSSPINDAPENITGPYAEKDTVQWDYVSLEDVLGDLNADPWTALSKLLGLPSSPVGAFGATEDILALLGTSDRRGLGYTEPICLPGSASFPTSQTLEDGYREDSASLHSGSIVSTPEPLLGRGYCDPYTRQQAIETDPEFVESPPTVLLHGTCLLPRCSRSPPRQRSVVHRHETVVRANPTADSQKVSENGEGFTREAVHVGHRGDQYIAFCFERDDNLGLVDGPSLFDDDDIWYCEG